MLIYFHRSLHHNHGTSIMILRVSQVKKSHSRWSFYDHEEGLNMGYYRPLLHECDGPITVANFNSINLHKCNYLVYKPKEHQVLCTNIFSKVGNSPNRPSRFIQKLVYIDLICYPTRNVINGSKRLRKFPIEVILIKYGPQTNFILFLTKINLIAQNEPGILLT